MILVLEQSPLMAMASTVCHFTLNSEARLQARGRDLILFSKISGLSRTSLGCLTASLGQGAGLWGMPSGHHLEAIAPPHLHLHRGLMSQVLGSHGHTNSFPSLCSGKGMRAATHTLLWRWGSHRASR